MASVNGNHHEIVVARLIKYLHELRADTKRITRCLGYERVVQGATEEWADSILDKYDEQEEKTSPAK